MDGTITAEVFEKKYVNEYDYVPFKNRILDTKNCNNAPYDWPDNITVKLIYYKNSDPEKHYWNVILVQIYKDNELFMEFGRDYSDLSEDQMVYVKQEGPDGTLREFIITTSNYMHITIVNLTDETICSYAIGDADKGWAFCPVKFDYYDFDGTFRTSELRINGCYWGAPFENYIFHEVDLTRGLTEKIKNKDYESEYEEADEYED